MSTIKIKAPAMPEPDGPWHWKNIKTGKSGLYEEDPRQFGVDIEHPEYQWARLPSADQLAARDAKWQEMVGPVVQAAAKVMARHEKEIAGRFCSEYIELVELREQLAALSAITEE